MNRMITGQKLDTKTLVHEMPEVFPLILLLMTKDINVVTCYDYSTDILDEDDSPIYIYYDGLMECSNTKFRKKRYDKWYLSIKVLEKDETRISIIGFIKSKKVRLLSSEIYSTKEVFKDCKSIQRRNKMGEILGRIDRENNPSRTEI